MLHEIFYWIFNMSLTATLVGSIVLLLRAIRKIPRRISVFLWVIPYFRMCIPFGLDRPYSLMSLVAKITTKSVVVYAPAKWFSFSTTNTVMAANEYFPITYKVAMLEDVFRIASIVWSIVLLAIVLTLGIFYVMALHEIKDATQLQGNVYVSDKVTSAAVYGVFRPKIVLPPSCPPEDIRFVLLHEQAHIKRADNLWRIVALFLTAVHWFNPLAWVFLKLLFHDMELACDERVLAALDAAASRAYAHSLLNAEESAHLYGAAFGGAKIRARIENILSFKKMTRLSLAGFLAFVIAVCSVLLTNAG